MHSYIFWEQKCPGNWRERLLFVYNHGKVICTRRAGHFIPLIKSSEKEKNRINRYLGRMRKVEIDKQNQIVKVKGS